MAAGKSADSCSGSSDRRRRVMTLLRWNRLPALGVGSLLLACGGGGGGGTGPCTPGLATHLTKTGGDAPAPGLHNPPPAAPPVTPPYANNSPAARVARDSPEP